MIFGLCTGRGENLSLSTAGRFAGGFGLTDGGGARFAAGGRGGGGLGRGGGGRLVGGFGGGPFGGGGLGAGGGAIVAAAMPFRELSYEVIVGYSRLV